MLATETFCQVVHMDAVICGMQTSITSGSGLACETQLSVELHACGYESQIFAG